MKFSNSRHLALRVPPLCNSRFIGCAVEQLELVSLLNVGVELRPVLYNWNDALSNLHAALEALHAARLTHSELLHEVLLRYFDGRQQQVVEGCGKRSEDLTQLLQVVEHVSDSAEGQLIHTEFL